MTPTVIIRFANVILAGIIAGILLGILLGFNPMNYSASTYIEQQQGAIKALNTLMPILGLITIIFTFVSAFFQRKNKVVLATLITAAILLIISGLITKFGNQPINQIVMTWHQTEAPNNWTDLRDKWWTLHQIRATTTLFAFFLIAGASIRRAE